MTVWRLHTKPSGGRATNVCLNKGIAAMGWSLYDMPQEERESIKSFGDYWDKATKYKNIKGESYGKGINNVYNLAETMQVDDLIWIRTDGKYYIGRVSENSQWFFNADPEVKEADIANQRTGIEWYPQNGLDESSVAGKIATSFIQRYTLQRIKDNGARLFSMYMFNRCSGKTLYPLSCNKKTADEFFSLLSPEDCEDLMAMWLFHKYRYVCVPSTNKLSTPTYECVLIDAEEKNLTNRKHIYIQSKNSERTLYADSYGELNGEVWLLCTKGKVLNLDKFPNTHVIDPQELFMFAMNKGPLIPEKILYWIDLMDQLGV